MRYWLSPIGCLGTYAEFPDSNVPGGTAQANVNTLDECKTVCYNAADSCAGFDFDSNPNVQYKCWTLTDVSGLAQGQRTGVTHYTLTSRSCGTVVTTGQRKSMLVTLTSLCRPALLWKNK